VRIERRDDHRPAFVECAGPLAQPPLVTEMKSVEIA
jgi:hypothetical protein